MAVKQQNPKKPVPYTNDNILESLRGVGGTVVKTTGDTAGKISSDVLTSLFGSLPKSGEPAPAQRGELKANQPIEFAPERQAVPHVARRPDILRPPTVSLQEINIKQQIEAVRAELKSIAESLKNLHQDVQKAIREAPVEPGIYHLNFFVRLRSFLKLLREQIDDSRTWLTLSAGRKKKMGYWGMYKKHGTTFGLSGERSIATQAG